MFLYFYMRHEKTKSILQNDQHIIKDNRNKRIQETFFKNFLIATKR